MLPSEYTSEHTSKTQGNARGDRASRQSESLNFFFLLLFLV